MVCEVMPVCFVASKGEILRKSWNRPIREEPRSREVKLETKWRTGSKLIIGKTKV
jgi:hypothetical protein